MAKKFCTTGTCIPEKNYMVDLSNRIQQIINQYIESGQYFTINRARQYGKTTLLYLLEKELRKQDYLVLSLSFEAADEVDKSSDNQIFLSFLGLLREKYLKCQQGKDVTFHSVILAGVYDIKTLKLKLHPQEESKYNSLWNIADNNQMYMKVSSDRNQFIVSGMLQMPLAMQKFYEYYEEIYSEKDQKFIEENGRKLLY
ncbi:MULTISPECIES: hypothetical protein [Anaerostipes]|jgi:hypothetical protein|uniref:hypothetical protein n=1 Tax=Anaerostipes TaxID=207244 RepID=UPI0006C5662D|nr:Uncharacterised protein [Anaerostipes hadrus]